MRPLLSSSGPKKGSFSKSDEVHVLALLFPFKTMTCEQNGTLRHKVYKYSQEMPNMKSKKGDKEKKRDKGNVAISLLGVSL